MYVLLCGLAPKAFCKRNPCRCICRGACALFLGTFNPEQCFCSNRVGGSGGICHWTGPVARADLGRSSCSEDLFVSRRAGVAGADISDAQLEIAPLVCLRAPGRWGKGDQLCNSRPKIRRRTEAHNQYPWLPICGSTCPRTESFFLENSSTFRGRLPSTPRAHDPRPSTQPW